MAPRRASLLSFERHGEPLAPRAVFLRRVARNVSIAAFIVLLSLALGMAGYAVTEGMGWVDSFVNAAMILSGMGPVGTLATTAGKIFAGCYALYSGLVLVLVSGIVLAPVAHRVLHSLHVPDKA